MLYINENQQIISEVNGVAIPQYPYKCDELHGVVSSIKSVEDLMSVADVVDEAVDAFLSANNLQGFNKERGLSDVGLAYVRSSKSSDKRFNYGASLFQFDFEQYHAKRLQATNIALSCLIKKRAIMCDEDTVFCISKDHSQILLINEGWEDNSKTIGTQENIDVTSCIFKELQRKYDIHFDKDNSFKHFFNDLYICHNLDMSKTLKALQDFLAGIFWDFEDGKDTMTIKVIKTAEELIGAGDF